jgi:hypothetical protein
MRTLDLPDMMKPFFLYIHERLGTLLNQLVSSFHCLVAYLSKLLDAVSQGWPPCLHILTTTTILVTEVDKLTLGQELTVHFPTLF